MPKAIFGFSKWLLLLLTLFLGRTAVAAEAPSMDAEAYNHRGIAYYKQGQYDQAIADYTKALEINPKYADVYNNRAYAYYYLKDYGRAWADLHEAQQLGAKIDTGFLKILREASGREE
jgi:Flp pilus assembly protein TadD